jgi:hypothetical protein
MNSSYDVRVYNTEVWEGKTKTTYYVRWQVANTAAAECDLDRRVVITVAATA